MDSDEYKSPHAALLWSVTMAGFGQFYNGQYIFGTLLLLIEITTNGLSGLNMAILHSFHGDFILAHDAVNYHWGLFYPSIYSFSMWHAYNKAICINNKQNDKKTERTYLTGFFFGLVLGMNLGVYWHHHFFDNTILFKYLSSPVFNGLLIGITFATLGHIIERIAVKLPSHK